MSDFMLNVSTHARYGPESPQDSGYDSSSPTKFQETLASIVNSPTDSCYSSRKGLNKRTRRDTLGKPRAESEYSDFKAINDEYRARLPINHSFDGPFDECYPATPATLPRLKSRTKPRRRPLLNVFDSNSSTKSTGGLRAPDRFVPKRNSSTLDLATQTFRVNKHPATLNSDERLLRHKTATWDAFSPRRRVTSPIPHVNESNDRRSVSGNRGGGGGASVLAFRQEPPGPNGERQVSVGTVWTVGGLAPFASGVPNGRGRLLGSGTNARLYITSFSASKPKAQEELDKHERRLAEALEIDRAARVLEFRKSPSSLRRPRNSRANSAPESKTYWRDTEWVMNDSNPKFHITQENRALPIAPFKVLDAPGLRDDFYCSVLAYSKTCHTLAVGLGALLYAWSEMQGVHLLNTGPQNGSWITALAFSSERGGKSILASGRSDGSLSLMSLYDSMVARFEVLQPCPIACITWRPRTTMRPSKCPMAPTISVQTEDLLVGDEVGNIYYYSVEWPDSWEVTRNSWSGSMVLLAKISIHTQQVCGLSFNGDGSLFATGGNDNLCFLFQSSTVLNGSAGGDDDSESVRNGVDGFGDPRVHTLQGQSSVKEITTGAEEHRWVHGAAVKAIAFCPWREGLVATGGGSNDKCIHFYHTTSGACLATISVSAQVTSLIWSTTRREIAATFGYAQPEHPYRIAVFSWPECKQVAAIPWEGEHRALYAIPYPGGPNESQTSREGGRGLTRTAKEGCIVVASSDESVKFHEVWTANQKATSGGEGLLGGSDILEALEGIDKEGDVIR